MGPVSHTADTYPWLEIRSKHDGDNVGGNGAGKWLGLIGCPPMSERGDGTHFVFLRGGDRRVLSPDCVYDELASLKGIVCQQSCFCPLWRSFYFFLGRHATACCLVGWHIRNGHTTHLSLAGCRNLDTHKNYFHLVCQRNPCKLVTSQSQFHSQFYVQC